jgi:hypothetical protein
MDGVVHGIVCGNEREDGMEREMKAKQSEVTDEEQKELHKGLVQELTVIYSREIGDMTKLTAMNVAIDFCVAALVHVFQSTNTIKDLEGKTIGSAITGRIDALVALVKSNNLTRGKQS